MTETARIERALRTGAAERQKVVAWLTRRRDTGDFCTDPEDELTEIISAIEAGTHLKKPEPSILASEWVKEPSVGHG